MAIANPADTAKRAHIISTFFTPMGLLLVANGVILTRPPSPTREILYGALIFSYLFNNFSARWVENDPGSRQFRVSLRVYLNLAINVLFIYLLGAQWKPVWLLLMLSPIASAIYGSKTKTITTSFFAVAILLSVNWLRGGDTPLGWMEQATYGMFIILLSTALYRIIQGTEQD